MKRRTTLAPSTGYLTNIASFLATAFVKSAVGLMAFLVVLAASVKADAADILSGGAMRPVMEGLTESFERVSGHRLLITYGTPGSLKDRIQAGEAGDVAIMARSMLDDLLERGRIGPGSIADVARSPMGAFVRASAPKPDIASVDAFKRFLLAAKSIAYADPATGNVSGINSAEVLKRLGVAEQMKAKTTLVADPFEFVAKGEAEIGMSQISQILPAAGVQLVGPFRMSSRTKTWSQQVSLRIRISRMPRLR